MKAVKYLFILLVVVLYSCQDDWNKHYGSDSEDEGTVVSPLNLLEYLKSQPQYASFVEALENTGVAEELSRNQFLTVWALNNEAMQSLSSMELPQELIMQFHVNNLNYDIGKLRDGLRLRSLSGKYIPIGRNELGETTIANASIVAGNQFCKNGVVHEVSELLIPQLSIYEYITLLSDEYSIIRDTILQQNVLVFDPGSSTPIGVDKTGNTIYDSVFVLENPLFDVVDIQSEFSQVTMFLPNDEIVIQTLTDLKALNDLFGRDFTREDTLAAFKWIKEALFFDEVITDYGNPVDIISAYGNLWRTTAQLINPEPIIMSNGRIYDMVFLKIPAGQNIGRIKSLVHYWEFLPDDQKDVLYTFENTTVVATQLTDSYNFPTVPASGTYKILSVTGDMDDGAKTSVEFAGLKLEDNNGVTVAVEQLVPAGKYYLYMGFRSKSHPAINIYFNGNLIKEALDVSPSTPWNYDRNNQTFPGTRYDGLGGLVDTVTVAGQGLASFKIKVEFERMHAEGTAERMEIYHWALFPHEDFY